MDRRLHLLRHATTEDARPGHPDRDRRLTPLGHRQAAELGRWLETSGTLVDLVWCSPAERTRQTAAGLRLTAPTTVEPSLYRADPEDVRELVAGCDPEVASLLVVGHNPPVAELAHALAVGTPEDQTIARRFPPGTLASFAVAGWDDLGTARLTGLRLP
ncbi:SixA phosphatase family protein [Auraticoccus monumenti]|uniref:Phosphohistidine phosphatase n=1 Tax=Auraticoccus monumenti TaxID=675864 RepID=A0A1G6RU62_9ACTN|nr:histidine phosphatase family protein [Auraticoccus monumenti]SDD08162.1 phosphohistidine phosphatase [Auraticoccus monumenti]